MDLTCRLQQRHQRRRRGDGLALPETSNRVPRGERRRRRHQFGQCRDGAIVSDPRQRGRHRPPRAARAPLVVEHRRGQSVVAAQRRERSQAEPHGLGLGRPAWLVVGRRRGNRAAVNEELDHLGQRGRCTARPLRADESERLRGAALDQGIRVAERGDERIDGRVTAQQAECERRHRADIGVGILQAFDQGRDASGQAHSADREGCTTPHAGVGITEKADEIHRGRRRRRWERATAPIHGRRGLRRGA